MWRYTAVMVLLLTLIMTSTSARSQAIEGSLDELTVAKAQAMLSSGQISSVDLVRHYVDRINKYDQAGPKINSVPQLSKNALADAKRLDNERKNGKVRGPLHGIPVVLKDNIDTADGMPNTAGSIALARNFPKDDAYLVRQLREAGAIILGKANLSEWANFRGFGSSSGWSSLWGQAKNPYNVLRSTCGSSAGSGAAVSANFTLLAIGTETDGSILCPSSVNGVVGIKPSLGSVSRDGIIPIAHSQDTAGPMARTVSDAVVLLEAMRGYDKNDPSPVKATESLVKHLKSDGLRGKRVGVVRNLMGYNKPLDKTFEQALRVFKANGAIIVDDLEMPNLPQAGEHEFTVLLYEFKHDLNSYLEQSNSSLTLDKLIAFNNSYKAEVMPHFGQEYFTLAQEKGSLNDAAYINAKKQAKQLMGTDGIDLLLSKNQLDVLIAPTTQAAWMIDWKNGDSIQGSSTSPAAISGYPSISVPMGFTDGMPVGLSIFGAFLSEGKLIEVAYAFEQATKQPSTVKRQPLNKING